MGMFAVHLLDFRGVVVVSFRTIPLLMILKMGGSDTRVQLSFTQLAIFCYKKPAYINFQWNIYVPPRIHGGNCIFAYIDPKQQKVRKYTIHEWYGCCFLLSTLLDATKSTYFRPTGLIHHLRPPQKNICFPVGIESSVKRG